jgi:hypothetical protein
MSELHRISTTIGEVLEPREVMARTLEGHRTTGGEPGGLRLPC